YQNSTTCISSGCEVWINNINTGYGNLTQQNSNQPQIGPSITGCAGTTVNAQQNDNKTACESGYDWTTNGVNASTTGNIYGIYDMSGGTSEYVMGVMYASDNSTPLLKESGFTTSTLPEEKYYETYNYYDPNATSGAGYLSVEEAYARYHLGDATRETLTRFQSYTGSSWYGDFNYLIDFNNPWIYRGASSIAGGAAGLFDYPYITGGPASAATFRAVISKP
ncbi:MAG: hypothetical protein IJ772_04400, partial [Bacilli bacterium]|nr:hypothetical protein [Bacilli bacterium]